MDKTQEIWFAIVNPMAGSGKTLAQWREAESYLFDKNIPYKFVIPETVLDSKKRIKAACHEGYRKFIAVGGDGTIHNALRSIIQYVNLEHKIGRSISLSDFTLAVLPIGSGNDWIKSHNIPRDHKMIVNLIASGSFTPQDIAKAEIIDPKTGKITNTAYMANVGGYSFDANVCDTVNFQKANGVTGKLMYVNALKKILSSQKCTKAKVVCDGKTVFDDYLLTVSFGNGRFSGGGLVQTPQAVMDDGLLEVMIGPKMVWWKILLSLNKLLKCHFDQCKYVKFFKASKIDLIPEGQGQLVEMDGDIIGRAPLHLEILPERINVLHLNAPVAENRL